MTNKSWSKLLSPLCDWMCAGEGGRGMILIMDFRTRINDFGFMMLV